MTILTPFRHRRDERGAVAAFVGFLVIVLVGVTAFAVDLGVQRVARQDMQTLADLVAMDLSRELDGRGIAELKPLMPALAAAAQERNQSPVGTPPLLEVDLGTMSPTGVFTELTSGTPNAVRVEATTTVPFAFAGVLGFDRGSATRSSIAMPTSGACFRLGSYAAAVRSDDSGLLNRLLGNALDFTAIGYEGIANSSVSLKGIAVELGAATPQDLMNSTVTVGRLAGAMANVLAREGGPTYDAQVTALRKLSTSTSAAVLKQFQLGALLNLTTAGASALATRVNVLDMIAAGGFLANGTNSVKTGVIWNLPAISNTEIALTISQVPQLACGRVGSAVARTGQLSYTTQLEYNRGNAIAGLAFQSSPLLSISADVARADGTLTALKCGAGTLTDQEKLTVHVDRSAPNLRFAVPVHLKGEISSDKYTKSLNSLLGSLGYSVTQILSLLSNLSKVKLSLDLNFDLGSATSVTRTESDVPFAHLPDAYDTAVPVPGRSPAAIPPVSFSRAEIKGSASLVIDGDVIGSIALVDVDLGFLVTEVTSRMVNDTINPLISKVNSVITPLSTALGVTLAGADLFVLPRPSCGVPSIAG